MPYDKLAELLRHPHPAFVCIACDSNRTKYVARVEHIAGPPAGAEALEEIQGWLGEYADDWLSLYSRHNGLILFQDRLPLCGSGEGGEAAYAAGIQLFPVEQWQSATEDLTQWNSEVFGDEELDSSRVVAVGTVPLSANYFVVPLEGPHAGAILYTDHETGTDEPFAKDLDDFFKRIVENPVGLLNRTLGGFVGYSDGETEEQWIPMKYLANALESEP